MQYEIRPAGKLTIGLKELWEFRELFYFFTWRDIKVKYKQAVLGVLWAVLQPLVMMGVLTFFFSRMVNAAVPANIPYPVFVFSGLLLWNLFSSGLSGSANSMVANANIIKKIYFPRLIIPLSSILVALFDFFMALIVFAALLIYYGQIPAISILVFLPAGILITLLTTFGLGTWLAALNIKYRDFRYIVPFLIQFLFFLTPVILPTTAVDIPWVRTILELNPLAASIELVRSSLLHTAPDLPLILTGSAVSVFLFLTGLFYFRKTEYYFADLA